MRKYPCPKCKSRSNRCSLSDPIFSSDLRNEIIIKIFCLDCCQSYEELYDVSECKSVRLVDDVEELKKRRARNNAKFGDN